MNDEVLMNYSGEHKDFNEVKRVEITLAKGYEKYGERWGDKYAGIPKAHPLKLHGVISDILNKNEQIKGIIEIGTYYGALSCYLGAECLERGYKPLMTFDNKVRYRPKLFKALKVNFVVDDCFSGKSIELIKEYVKDTPVLFICDGGNKAREFNTFAPLLPGGSIIAVHDWNIEVNMQGIKETVDQQKMCALEEKQWNAPPDHTLMAFFGKLSHINKEKKGNKQGIYIGIPTTGNIRMELAKWLLETTKNREYTFDIFITGNNTISHNRNLIVRGFLKSSADWLLTIDSDVCPPLNIFDLTKDGKKIIAPINFVWKPNGLSPLLSKKVKDGRGYIITDPEAANSKENLVEVDGTGTTCLFIHREVLEKMEPPYFMFGYDEQGAINLGEDYSFCQKAKELGYGIWIDKRYITDHYKNTSLKIFNDYMIKEMRLGEERFRKKVKEELEKYEMRKKE